MRTANQIQFDLEENVLDWSILVCFKISRTVTGKYVQCNLDIVKKLVSGQYFTIRTFFTIQMFVSKDDMGCRFTPN